MMNGKFDPWKALAWMSDLLSVIAIGLAAWTGTTLLDVDRRLTRVEAQQFGVERGRELWAEIAKIREGLAGHSPPQWFIEKVDKVSAQLERVEALLVDHISHDK